MFSPRHSAVCALFAVAVTVGLAPAARAQDVPPPAAITPSATPPGADAPQPDNTAPVTPTKSVLLWNRTDFSGWYTFLPSRGVNADPEKVFSVVTDGGKPAIKITGKEFGYLATLVPYTNYQLTFQVKWGEARYPPRETAVRDSGVLVHMIGADKVWPQSFECQIQENDFGDIFHIGGVSSVVNGKRQNDRVVRGENAEKPHGEWNTITLFCKGDVVINIVNDKLVNVASGVTRGRDGTGGALTTGRIAFQSEGAEVYYRAIFVTPVDGRDEPRKPYHPIEPPYPSSRFLVQAPSALPVLKLAGSPP